MDGIGQTSHAINYVTKITRMVFPSLSVGSYYDRVLLLCSGLFFLGLGPVIYRREYVTIFMQSFSFISTYKIMLCLKVFFMLVIISEIGSTDNEIYLSFVDQLY